MITLTTPEDCVKQILHGYETVQRGYGIADEAICAYLQMDGCSVQTLHRDLQEAGCEITIKTLYNRQSMLRGEGLLPAPKERFQRDGNGGYSRVGNRTEGPNAKLTGDLYRLGERMVNNGERFNNCVKPDEFETATSEQFRELIETILDSVTTLGEAIAFYETNIDWLATGGYSPSYVLQRIDSMKATRKEFVDTFGHWFSETD